MDSKYSIIAILLAILLGVYLGTALMLSSDALLREATMHIDEPNMHPFISFYFIPVVGTMIVVPVFIIEVSLLLFWSDYKIETVSGAIILGVSYTSFLSILVIRNFFYTGTSLLIVFFIVVIIFNPIVIHYYIRRKYKKLRWKELHETKNKNNVY